MSDLSDLLMTHTHSIQGELLTLQELNTAIRWGLEELDRFVGHQDAPIGPMSREQLNNISGTISSLLWLQLRTIKAADAAADAVETLVYREGKARPGRSGGK